MFGVSIHHHGSCLGNFNASATLTADRKTVGNQHICLKVKFGQISDFGAIPYPIKLTRPATFDFISFILLIKATIILRTLYI